VEVRDDLGMLLLKDDSSILILISTFEFVECEEGAGELSVLEILITISQLTLVRNKKIKIKIRKENK